MATQQMTSISRRNSAPAAPSDRSQLGVTHSWPLGGASGRALIVGHGTKRTIVDHDWQLPSINLTRSTLVLAAVEPEVSTSRAELGVYLAFSLCPPNSERSAERTLSVKSPLPRDSNRS